MHTWAVLLNIADIRVKRPDFKCLDQIPFMPLVTIRVSRGFWFWFCLVFLGWVWIFCSYVETHLHCPVGLHADTIQIILWQIQYVFIISFKKKKIHGILPVLTFEPLHKCGNTEERVSVSATPHSWLNHCKSQIKCACAAAV